MKLRATLIIACLLARPLGAEDPLLEPTLIIFNAKVHTLDPDKPRVEAVAISGNRIAAVGSAEEIRKLAGRKTRVIDAAGRLVLPGFNDAHVHFLSGGFQLSNLDLRETKTPREFAERIRDFALKIPRGRWITGGGWDHERWPGATLPTKELIDAGTPETPVFVNRLDGHMALANSYALKLAGVTRETKDPPGGLMVRDSQTGEPTGILKDAAMAFVNRVIPEKSFEEKLAAARAATAHAASLGVTSVQDMSAGAELAIYQELARRGELKTRIYAVAPLPSWERLAKIGLRAPFGNAVIRIGGLKGFADGSLGSSTAYFFEPYLDAPNTYGLPADQMLPEGSMLRRVQEADRAGLHVMVHAIGDRANHEMLTIYEQATQTNGPRDRRFRIEHAQHLRPQDIARFAKARVIASMQPYHAADDGRWAEKRIGPQRTKGTYAFRSLLDAGVTLAFGSDWPVAPLDPLQGITAAVTRRTLDGKHPEGWVPEEKITAEEAVRAFTAGAAYAEFEENSKSTMTPGKLADLIILSHDILSADFDWGKASEVRVVATIFDGSLVYEAAKSGP